MEMAYETGRSIDSGVAPDIATAPAEAASNSGEPNPESNTAKKETETNPHWSKKSMNRSLSVYLTTIILHLILGLIYTKHAYALAVFAEVGETTTFNSNVYLDELKEWDFIITPNAALDVELGRIYGLGYAGQVSVYPRHSDLLFHTHYIYFLLNPCFGKEEQNEFILDLSISTQKNKDEYADVNLVEPVLFMSLEMSPLNWLRWSLSETGSYRWFYDNKTADNITSWTRGDITLTAPTRTTFSPRLIYGMRYYLRETGTDLIDHQLHVGARLSQNIAEGVGLRLDYAYIHAFEESVLVVRNLDALTFHYIGEDFLFTGHKAHTGLKIVLDNGFTADASLHFEKKRYNGWPVRDELGVATTETREDQVLSPTLLLSHHITPSKDAAAGVPGLKISLQYAFARNWSNDEWFDTNRHLVSLGLTLDW